MTNEIEFVLTAIVDGETVYSHSFGDTAMLEEDGLRKAERAVADVVDSDLLIQEDEDDD